jgi:hypothetical protein
MLRLATTTLARRCMSTAAAAEASSPSSHSIVQAASSILSFSTENVLEPGSVIVNIGAETSIGQTITVGAAMRGLTTINVVSQDAAAGYPGSVSHVYSLGGDYVVTESFLGFRGFKELMEEVCDGKSPSLVINGSTLIDEGTAALGPFKQAKKFTDKKSAIEDMQDNNTIRAASRVASLGSLIGDAPIVTHDKYKSKGTEEQTDVANDLMNDLSSMMILE